METRKQIIELIEPYMDKTLSEGCYVEWPFDIIKVDKASWNLFQTTNGKRKTNWILWKDRVKMLWHYEITAVEKYARAKIAFPYHTHYSKDWNITWNKKGETGYCFRYIHKPLHLYTEQEEKDLLELLQRIWKT